MPRECGGHRAAGETVTLLLTGKVKLLLSCCMSMLDSLLAVAKGYAVGAKVDLSTVSWRVFGDTKKLAAMEAGADIQVRRLEKAMRWFSENWPEGAEWPAGVARPERVVP
jgi:hypothetical protein